MLFSISNEDSFPSSIFLWSSSLFVYHGLGGLGFLFCFSSGIILSSVLLNSFSSTDQISPSFLSISSFLNSCVNLSRSSFLNCLLGQLSSCLVAFFLLFSIPTSLWSEMYSPMKLCLMLLACLCSQCRCGLVCCLDCVLLDQYVVLVLVLALYLCMFGYLGFLDPELLC